MPQVSLTADRRECSQIPLKGPLEPSQPCLTGQAKGNVTVTWNSQYAAEKKSSRAFSSRVENAVVWKPGFSQKAYSTTNAF